jgi:hypothetical protein
VADDSVGDAVPEQGPEKNAAKRTGPTGQLARGELMHAEVKPLDLSGIPTVAVGIVAWAIAFFVLLFFRDDLQRRGEEWWIWVAVAGFGMGLVGLLYTRRRWAAIEAEHSREAAQPPAVSPAPEGEPSETETDTGSSSS